MLPVTDEQAKAVTAVAEFGKTVVEQGSPLARAFGRVVGTIPEDVVGLVFGDPLRYLRTKQALKLEEKITRILEKREVKQTEPVSLSVAIPLLSAAYDESRAELEDIWAALIAAAMDPARSDRVRLSFIEIVKQMDPLDALLLKARCERSGGLGPNAVDFFASNFNRRREDIYVSAENLVRLRCFLLIQNDVNNFTPSFLGRELVRACSAQ